MAADEASDHTRESRKSDLYFVARFRVDIEFRPAAVRHDAGPLHHQLPLRLLVEDVELRLKAPPTARLRHPPDDIPIVLRPEEHRYILSAGLEPCTGEQSEVALVGKNLRRNVAKRTAEAHPPQRGERDPSRGAAPSFISKDPQAGGDQPEDTPRFRKSSTQNLLG